MAFNDDRARCVWNVGALLGEGPVWDARDGAVWFVDIETPAIHRYRLADDAHRSWTPPFRVTALWPRAAGGFVAHSERGFLIADPVAGRYELFHATEPGQPGNRSNDGKIDAAGRFWSGTMDDSKLAASGALYRLDPDRRVHRIDDGYRITNGPAFSPDGRIMYHTDTIARTVYAFDVAVAQRDEVHDVILRTSASRCRSRRGPRPRTARRPGGARPPCRDRPPPR